MHDGAERVRHRKTHRPNLDSISHIPLPEDITSASSPSQAHRHAQRPSLTSTSSSSSSSAPSWKTQCHLFLYRLFSFPNPGRKRRILLALISGIIILFPFNNVLFGYKKLHGGAVGRAVDCTVRTESFRTTMAKRNRRLQEHGFYLPPLVEVNVNKRGIPVLTQSYLAETLLRASERQRRRVQAEQWDKCKNGGVPPWVLQPNVGKWFRPLYLNGNSVDGENDLLEFEESEMRDFMMTHFPSLPDNDTVIWGLCAVYWYGGVFVTHEVQDLRSVSSILEVGNDRSCMDTAVIHFEGNDHLRVLKATPRHPLLACAIQKLQGVDSPGTVDPSIFADGWNFDEPTWFERNCNSTVACCNASKADRVKGTLNIQVTDIGDVVVADTLKGKGGPRVDVVIKETSHAARGAKVAKQSLADHLTGSGCNAGWICNRCLKTEWFGSYKACSAVCPPCYEQVICHDPHGPVRSDVLIDVLVQERRPFDRNPHRNNKNREENRIPRIIHQTYFEELTPDRYPHLYRLQNSWRASGWEYRFYTDAIAREYIIKNFPSFFIEAFDALNPGAFKADFFRILVLLKDGGVYADVDVKLDINLDSFITPNLGFFSPQDLVAGHGDGNYCLWNGLIGAAPGHAFLISAVERTLNMVLNRGDYYDMEREACRYASDSGATEVWKLRALEILLLTGPCALGVSVNSALLKQSSVEKLNTGWLRTPPVLVHADIGDVLILVADKHDMGELRFTDVDRNILVASTDQTLLTKSPFETYASNLDHLNHQHAKSHYSTMEHSSDIFGTTDIYIDNLVTNENYKLRIVNSPSGFRA